MLSAETGPPRQAGSKDAAVADAESDAGPDAQEEASTCACNVCCTPATACESGFVLQPHTDCKGSSFQACFDTYTGGCI